MEQNQKLEKLFCTYNQAKELKELGMDEPCLAYYHDGRITGVNKWNRKDWEFHILTSKEITVITNEVILAPLKQQVFSWFREKHNLCGEINREDNKQYSFSITKANWYEPEKTFRVGHIVLGETLWDISSKPFETYEQAESECIDKLISILKEKQ